MSKTLSILLLSFLLINFSAQSQTRGVGYDIGAVAVISPVPGTILTQGNSYPVTVRIKNYGTGFPPLSVSVMFKVGTDSVIETSSLAIGFGDSMDVTFTNNLVFTNATSGSGAAWTGMAGEFNPTNDTVYCSYIVTGMATSSMTTTSLSMTQVVIHSVNDNEITLVVSDTKNENAVLTLYNITGKIIRQQSVSLLSGNTLFNIYSGELASGIYIATIKSQRLVSSAKVMVL